MARVLYVSADAGVPILGHKGASVHVRSLSEAFAALGHEVTIASPRVEPGENSLPDSIRLVALPPVIPKVVADERELVAVAERQAREAVALARAIEPDLVYERYSLASFAGAAIRDATGTPLVVEVNAPLRDEAARFRELRHEDAAKRAEKRTFAAANALFAVSPAIAEWLASEGVARDRIQIVPNAYPSREYPPRAAPSRDSDVVVGFSGGMKAWHGVEILLEAFALVLERGGRMRLVMAGQGPREDLVRSAPLPPDRFEWVGHIAHDRALELLGRWDIGVAPFTDMQGFWFSPLKLYEYMAAGLCPVVSDVGSLSSIVERGGAGVIVPPGDAHSLADALLELDSDRARLHALGRRAWELAQAGPRWTDNARRALACAQREAAA